MLFSSILLMIPQILSHKTSKFDESSLSTDMDNLYSNVKDIAVHDTYNINSIDESSVNRDNMPSDTSKFEELVSKAINNATDDIHDTIVNEHKNMEINDKIFAVTLDHLKKFWFTGQCKRDYSAPCPKGLSVLYLGWSLESDSCLPPESYNGNCREYNVNRITTSKQKEEFAYKCKSDWPCIKNLAINYNTVCPYNWVHIGNNYCLAPANYSMKCSPFMNFSTFTNNEKAIWSMECNLHWPTMSNATTNMEVLPKDNFFGALSDVGHIIYPQNY